MLQRSSSVTEHAVRVPASTNFVAVSPTQTIAVVTPETIATNRVTNTVYAVNTNWTATIRAIDDVNRAVNVTPTGPLVTLALTGLSGILGLIARAKTQKAELLRTVIAGVESVPANQSIKETIANLAKAQGVETRLNRAVKEVTEP